MSKIKRRGAEEARKQLPQLLADAEKGAATIITKHGRPIAALVPIEEYERNHRQLSIPLLEMSGGTKGSVRFLRPAATGSAPRRFSADHLRSRPPCRARTAISAAVRSAGGRHRSFRHYERNDHRSVDGSARCRRSGTGAPLSKNFRIVDGRWPRPGDRRTRRGMAGVSSPETRRLHPARQRLRHQRRRPRHSRSRFLPRQGNARNLLTAHATAVSTRKIRSPIDTVSNPARSNDAISSSMNPSSGPIASVTGPRTSLG